MSESNETKKSGMGGKVVGVIILLAILGGVWQCVTGGKSGSEPTASSTASTDQAIKDVRNSPAARVNSQAEAQNFVLGLRQKGVDKSGVSLMNESLKAVGANHAAELIDQANDLIP